MSNLSLSSLAPRFFAVLPTACADLFDAGLRVLQSGSRRTLARLHNLVIILVVAAFGMPVYAQTLAPSWYQQSPAASPPVRYIHAITYDQAHNQVVLFGGFGQSGYLNDTWLWNGTTWTQASPAHTPSTRAAHAMVYDPAHGQVVMFGGLASASSRLGDTWLWNGTDWTQANPVNSPPARDGAVMVYDAATNQVLLFGGVNGNGVNINDTWVWDGTNWTQQNPANAPLPRADYSMVYDAATGQVILFGGEVNAVYFNDTWIWNGTNWIQEAPANSPPARYSQGMAYNAVLGKTVMFGGYNGSFLNDTWTYDGTNWTQDFTASSPSGRYAPNAMTYDAAQGQVILFGGLGSAQTNDTWAWSLPGNFGNVNVCPSGQTTPAPCSNTLTLTFDLATTLSLGPIQVVTQGAPGLDFQLSSGSTCTGTVAPPLSCTVNVTFSPRAPGLSTGAVRLVDTAGNLLTSALVYGVGQGPAPAFAPATQTSVSTSANYPLNQPKGLAVDAAGDLFIADNGNHRVVKTAPTGLVSTVGFGLNYPQGLAVDGAGNLFIADNNLNQVVEVPAGCSTAACQRTVGFGLAAQLGVAVDGAGDVFIGDFTGNQVVKVPAGCNSGACQTLVYGGPGTGSNPVGLAVDAAGDLFVADFGLRQIVQVPAGCSSSSCQIKVGQGWVQPEAVAVDAAGDVFVADQGNRTVAEVPPGCASISCQTNVLSGVSAEGLAIDAQGNVFVADFTTSQVIRVNRSLPPSLSFAATNVGATSSDSPQSVMLQNIGNQSLAAVAPGLIVNGPSFVQAPGSGSPVDCSTSFTLSPGGACNLSLSFKPQSAGNPLTGSAVLTDNALNAASSAQSIALTGIALSSTFGLSVAEIGSGTGTVNDSLGQIVCSEANGTVTGTCAGNYAGGTLITLTATASGTSRFLGWGGVCASAGTSSTCNLSVSQAANASASFVDQNFGNVNVCPSGQGTPAPCGRTLALTYNLATTTTVGAIQVVTQGTTGLDFSLGSGSTCTGSVAGGSACSVNVSFTPRAPGLRLGAVELFDNSGTLLATTPIYGIGQEPAIAFGPGTQTAIPANGLSGSLQGVAVDAAGNIYIADSANNKVVKITPAGTQLTLPVSGLSGPAGLAVDGAGDVFIANVLSSQVVEVTPAGLQTTVNTPGFTLSKPNGVAVDGAGNLFIADTGNGRVLEVPANGGSPSAVATGLTTPVAVALDPSNGLIIADTGTHTVLKVINATQFSVSTTLTSPSGLAVDAAGDVYIADGSHNTVIEVSPSGVQTVLISTAGGAQPFALALNATGDVLLVNSNVAANQLVKINRSQPAPISFAVTNVGSTSSVDSPHLVAIQNIGNQLLTGSLALNLGSGFAESYTPDCLVAFSLVPGASCSEAFTFKPVAATYFLGTAVLTDNAFNSAPLSSQTITFSGTGAINGQAGTVAVPDVTGQAQATAATPLSGVGLVLGTVTSAASDTIQSGNVISQNPVAGTQVAVGSAVNLLVSSGIAQPPSPNPLLLENNYFLTGDYVSAGVTLRGTGAGGVATGSITIPKYIPGATEGVPDGADIVDAFLYWETLENTASPSSTNGTFNHYPIVGQQIGSDLPNFKDGAFTGTIRAYRANVNVYLPAGANGIRFGSGTFAVSLPDSGGSGLPLTEGASLVIVYRVLSPNFPLKSVIIYDGSALPVSSTVQVVKGFYDAAGGANGTGKNTNIFASAGAWNNSVNSSAVLGQSDQFHAVLNPANAYAAVILSTPVKNSDNDGLLDAWKDGPPAGDFHVGQPGYYDAKSGAWVGLPGAKHGEKDLFVQLDYMCGAVMADGSCDPTKENLFPSPDSNGNDPLVMVKQAFTNSGVHLHLQIGNAVPESTCVDDPANPSQLCQFPNQPGVIGWKNSLEFSKLFPRNLAACLTGGDCTTRFPYGQKDSYHYVLFGHSLAVPFWNSRYGTLTSINVANGITTIGTVDRGNGINACPSRITISGVLGNPSLNGVYNTTSCADAKTITLATPGVTNWSYPNSTLPEPVIGLTSGTISSISGYSDLGGADSAVTLGLWLTAPNQDMSKRANVIGGTLFHEIGHTLGLSHGGLYYDTPGSYVPTFEGNCKPNYQSVMNYLFQLDLVGPNQAIALSNQTLAPLNESNAGSTTQLTDTSGNPATFPTSAWYVPYISGSPVSPATRHCDGTPLNGDAAYRVDSSIAPITPSWSNGQDLNFIGTLQTQERGFNDLANMDLRQVGATGGEFASLATLLSFGSSVAPLNISAGGNVVLGSGGTIALGSGGTVTLGSGGNVTLGSGGTITLGSGGTVTLGSGGNVTLGSGGTVTPGSGGTVALGSGGNVTLGSGGTITLGSGGNVTLGSGGTIALGSGGTITVPSTGGTYSIDGSGGTITLGSGGNVTLGSGGNVTLGSGGTIALGSGGNVTLGSGGNVTLGSGGTIALGSGGNVILGSGGNVTLGSGGTIALGSGGTITLGSGGNVTLGSGGTVTLGSGGNVALGSGGNVTLGSGGAAVLGAGGTVTLGSGGNVTLGSGGNVTLGSGGTITLGSGGTVTLGSGGTVTLGSGGTVTLSSGGTPISIGAGGTVTLGSGGTVTLGSGGNVTLGSGGNVTLGSGGNITLGSGGTITLGSGGNVTLGSGGVVTLGSGGSVTLGTGSETPLGTVNNVAPGSGGPLPNELTYETANSIVRPPTSPTETSTPAGVRITWNAPAFGVVQTYTIYRSSDGATPNVIGSVSGVNGYPPATEFTDTNPDLTSKLVVYTISTLLAPDTNGPARQSLPSPPAVLKNDQSISLGPLPSSVTLATPPTLTATALSGGVPNGLQVVFSATGACAIGSQSFANNVSSAVVSLNTTGSCTVTASQPGTNAFNAANAVSGTFTVLANNSTTQSQTINFAPLQNAQYGGSFSLSATSSAGLPVSFTAIGPCTTAGVISGVGVCTITASAPGNGTYSPASLTQSFTIFPAVLKVTATNLSITYGQPLPALTSSYSGFVRSDTAAVVSGAPALSTTATTSSNAGSYPITVSTGTLATANYSFLYVNGTLTVQPAPLTITPDGSKTKIYGATFTAFTGKITGLQYSDAVTVTYASTGAPATAAVGSYDITVATYNFTAGSAANYAITQNTTTGGLKVLYASAGTCAGNVGHTVLQPISADGTSVWKAGRTIPTQFRVCDANGNSVGPTAATPNVVASYGIVKTYAGTVTSVDETVTATNNDTAFRWDATGQQWIYNTATGSGTNLVAGYTYLMQIKLADGTFIGSSGANGAIPIGPFPAGTVGYQFGLK